MRVRDYSTWRIDVNIKPGFKTELKKGRAKRTLNFYRVGYIWIDLFDLISIVAVDKIMNEWTDGEMVMSRSQGGDDQDVVAKRRGRMVIRTRVMRCVDSEQKVVKNVFYGVN